MGLTSHGEQSVPNLTESMKQVIKQQPVAFIATVEGQGTPNVAPRAVLKILGDDQLVWADLFSFRTWANLQANPQIAVAVVDPQTHEGYQFRGWAEGLEHGELFDEVAALLASAPSGPQPMELWFEKEARGLLAALRRAGRTLVRPSRVVVLHIKEIRNLSPGHEQEIWL
jgi:hypothetical protein